MYVDMEKECMAHPRGIHYYGTSNTSQSGEPCLAWTDGPIDLVTALPDDRTVEARNYCRYVPGQNWTRPSCIVSADGDVDECDVPYCGGQYGPILYSDSYTIWTRGSPLRAGDTNFS